MLFDLVVFIFQTQVILKSKEPSYIRCIKPNDDKMAKKLDLDVVRHQVKYLGLMENLRVRRAGFAYRRGYEYFLARYKSLCPATWPHPQQPAKEAVQLLVNHLKVKMFMNVRDLRKLAARIYFPNKRRRKDLN